MTERSRRELLLTFLLTPMIVLGVVALAVITLRTTFQIERLRLQSVLQATASVANEKADRLDKRIIEEDNVVAAETDLSAIGSLARRWLPTASRETPTVRAVLVMRGDGEHDVYDYASQSPGPDDDVFRRLLIHRLLPQLEPSGESAEELKHLHSNINGQSYLVSYWRRIHDGKKYVIVAWHDVPHIVHSLFPRMLEDAMGHARVHVVDEQGRTIYGQPTAGGAFTVGRPFETTLYGWKLFVTLTTAEELSESVERRQELERVSLAVSFLVVVAGVIIVVVAAERERRLARLKSDFVANVSHELKTPLSLVRMFSELLSTGRVRDDTKRQQYISIIVRESERLSSLIENVLDFAQLERGKAAYQFDEGSVGDIVTRTVDAYRHRWEHEGVEIRLDVQPDLPPTLLDDRALELALVNLMDNAVKYAKDGKTIDVSVRMRGARTIETRVTDHGPGIPHEEQRLVFDRFMRGKGARDQRIRGSGIGLSLVQHIARSHGGRAWVESEIGKGASFFLALPVRVTTGAKLPAKPNEPTDTTNHDTHP